MSYSHWPKYLTDVVLNITVHLHGHNPQINPQSGLYTIRYNDEMFAESMLINMIGAALVGLAIVMPIILGSNFHFTPYMKITHIIFLKADVS